MLEALTLYMNRRLSVVFIVDFMHAFDRCPSRHANVCKQYINKIRCANLRHVF